MQPRTPGTPQESFPVPTTPLLAHLVPAQHAQPVTPITAVASYQPPTKRSLQVHDESAAKKLKEDKADEPAKDTYVVVCKDADDVATKTIVGEYIEKGENHGRKVYQKKATSASSGGGATHVNVLLYYWDEQDGSKYTGWWLGHRLGGTQVWAQNPAKDKQPPRIGWRVPWDGPVRVSVQVMTKSEKWAAEREEELDSMMEQVATLKAEAMYTWSQVSHPRMQQKLTVGKLSEAESSLAAHLINAEAMHGKLKSLEASTKQMQSPVVLLFKKVRGAALGLQNGLQTELEKVRDKRRVLELKYLEKEAEQRDKVLLESFVEECKVQLTGLARSVETAIQAVRDAQKAVVEEAKTKQAAVAAQMAEAEKSLRDKEAAQKMEAAKSQEEKKEATETEKKQTPSQIEQDKPGNDDVAERLGEGKEGKITGPTEAKDDINTTGTAAPEEQRQAEGHVAEPQIKADDEDDAAAPQDNKKAEVPGEQDEDKMSQKRKAEEMCDEQQQRVVEQKLDEEEMLMKKELGASEEKAAPEDNRTQVTIDQQPDADAAGKVVSAERVDADPVSEKPVDDVAVDEIPIDVDMCKLHAEESVTASMSLLACLKEMLSKHMQSCTSFQDGARLEADRSFGALQLQLDAQSVLLAPYNDIRLAWEQERVTKESTAKLFKQSKDLEALRVQATEALDKVEKSKMPEAEAGAALAAVEAVQEAHKALQQAVQNCDLQTRQSLSVHIPSMLVAASGTVRQIQGRWKELQQMAKANESLNSVRSEVTTHAAALAAFETDIKTMQDAIKSGDCEWVTDELNKVEAELYSLVGSITNTRVHTQVKALEVRRFSSDACKASLVQFQELQLKLGQSFGPQANKLKDEIKKLRGALLVHEVEAKVCQIEESAQKAKALSAVLGSAAKILETPLPEVQASFIEWQSLSQAVEQAKSTRQWVQAKQIEVKHQKSGWEWSSDIAKRMARLTTAQLSLERDMQACAGSEAHLATKQTVEDWSIKCASAEERVSKMHEAFSKLCTRPHYPETVHDLGESSELMADLAPAALLKEAEQAHGHAAFHEKLVGKNVETMDWQAMGPGFAELGAGIRSRLEVVKKQVSESAVVLQEYKEAVKAWPLVQESLKDYRECMAKVKAVEGAVAVPQEDSSSQTMTPAAAIASLRRVKSLLHVKEITLKNQCQLAPTARTLVASMQAEVERMLQKMPHLQKALNSRMTAPSRGDA
mmetsp:Transcript_37744/g.87205  ORF Transcript_37744/g.87205 Transcript_37744/m.87205 type:complete len:1215 (-) Transcript_37744:8-3652(-)